MTRRALVVVAAIALLASACGTGAGGGDTRTVLVDFSHDQFASFMIANFPEQIEVTPGMTVVFKQTWTGEPHTVTGGSLVNEMMEKGKPWMDFFGPAETLISAGALPDPEQPTGTLADAFRAVSRAKDKEARDAFFEAWDRLRAAGVPLPDRRNPGDATFASAVETIDEESNKFFEDIGVPWAFGEEGVTQNAGQPCYLEEGAPPKEEDEACAESRQRQPVFDGEASYYNSGIIPYEGPQGNTFRVELAEDIEPGSYFFYCAVHGPDQSTEVKVVPEGTEIPSQQEVSRRAREEIAKFTEPMAKTFADARDGTVGSDGETIRGPFAGLSPPVHGSINEFVPKTMRVRVGEPVTWKLMGADHTITFDVPEYFPIIRFAEDGEVTLNPKLEAPAGGSPALPEDDEGDGPPPEGPPQITKIDGGTYDGTGFFSSGLFGGQPYAEYTLRFSQPGTYKYACLLHPPMVGTVEVRT